MVVDDRIPTAPAPDPRGLDLGDRHPSPPVLRIGDAIDAADFDAATRLGSLRPVDVGSGAAALHVTIDDQHGFSVDSGKGGWSAVFGFYTPTIRQPELIPGQVRLLRSLLAGREDEGRHGHPGRRPKRHLHAAACAVTARRSAVSAREPRCDIGLPIRWVE